MATVKAYRAVRMNQADFYYGEIEESDSDEIIISDGVYTTTYDGRFFYNIYGDVFGRLSHMKLEYLDRTQVEVSDINRNANKFYEFAYQGDNLRALAFVLSGQDRVFGSAGNDYLMGFEAPDFIAGNGGDDVVVGGRGEDKLDAGSGTDKLIGEGGADRLAGGFGSDEFVYRDKADSTLSDRDAIKDFGSGGDVLDLGAIDANTKAFGNQRFAFIGDDRFSGDAGELRVTEKENVTLLFGDTNGDEVADFSIWLAGAPSVREQDLVL